MLPACGLIVLLALTFAAPRTFAQPDVKAPLTSDSERDLLHAGEEWRNLQPHLPSPTAATAAQLEMAGDVLRARRFPEDALDFYGYAMARGGNVSALLNKMGIVRLELRQYDLARQMFLRVVRADKKNALAWNNLGATEYLSRNFHAAATNYRKAISLDKHSAVFHANLGLVRFETGDNSAARSEFAKASALDPTIMQRHDSGGISAHLLSSAAYPRLCYEFARMAAMRQNATETRLWLARAVEGGFDVLSAMRDDSVMRPYVKDPEVLLILSNAKQLHNRKIAAGGPIPSLGKQTQQVN